MKMIIAFTACVILLTSSLASAEGTALASGGTSAISVSIYGGVDTTDAASASATLIGKLSKGVKMSPTYSTTGYAIATKHDSGNTQYGTAHDATAIYKQEVGTATLSVPAAASYSSFSTWTAM